MKYNPKINEVMAGLEGFRELHPYQPEDQVQGALELMWTLQQNISDIAFRPAMRDFATCCRSSWRDGR